jgi:DNA-binding GntR family transcriptional regulator
VVIALSLHEDVSAEERVFTPAPPLPSSLAELAAEWITARIIAGDIRPGDKLTEGALAEAAGMSRSPIREALRSLSSQGLVSVEPRRAATVALLSARDATDLYECRLLLEPRCMAAGSLAFSSEVGAELGDCMDQMTMAAQHGDGHNYLDVVTRYSRALQDCCPNRLLASMTAAAQKSSLRYTTILVRSSQQYLMLSLANNMELHAAVSARDEAGVHEATTRVLTSARDQLLELISNIPGGLRSSL